EPNARGAVGRLLEDTDVFFQLERRPGAFAAFRSESFGASAAGRLLFLNDFGHVVVPVAVRQIEEQVHDTVAQGQVQARLVQVAENDDTTAVFTSERKVSHKAVQVAGGRDLT